MAGSLHDSIKSFLLEVLRSRFEGVFTTELKLLNRRLDIASRNYRLIVEVEPTQNEVRAGKNQVITYAKKIMDELCINSVHAVVCYHRTARTADDYFGGSADELAFEHVYVDTAGGNVEFKTISFNEFIKIAEDIAQEKLPLDLRTFAGVVSNIKEAYMPLLEEMFIAYRQEVGVLYSAYKKEMVKVYADNSEDRLERIFVIHTFLNLLALSLIGLHLKGMAPGVENLIEVKKGYSLPFLNWLLILYKQGKLTQQHREEFKKLVDEMGRRLSYFEWRKEDLKDVFRVVYEEFIKEEERRILGEYYTPLWFVRWCMDRLDGWENSIVVDPCCGTGSFLVEAYRRKIQAGKSPEDALREVVGFDINPLAVVLSRAILYVSYLVAGGDKEKDVVPYVFYADSALEFGDRLRRIREKGKKEEDSYINSLNILSQNKGNFRMLNRLENFLETCFEEVEEKVANIAEYEERKQAIEKELKSLLSEKGEISGFARVDTLVEVKKIAEEIARFGNGIWSLLVVSQIAKYMVDKAFSSGYMVATNPPWITLSKLKGEFGSAIRRKIKENYRVGGRVLSGGDIASYFVCRWLKKGYGRKNIRGVFILPSKQVYAGTYGVGSVFTRVCVEGYDHTLYVFNDDIFRHGIPPGVVVVGSGSGDVYRVKLTSKYDKKTEDYKQEDILLESVSDEEISALRKTLKHKKSYGISKIASEVRVNGVYIRGFKGGLLKRGAEPYAGLIVEKYDPNTGMGRLVNMQKDIFLAPFEKYMKNLFYADLVFPFRILEPYRVLLSPAGQKGIVILLQGVLKYVQDTEDRKKLTNLIKEVKQDIPVFLKKGRYYLMHRVVRMFSCGVFECPEDDKYVIDSTLCYAEFTQREPAYYYAGLINYLLYRTGKGFHRNIHSRVLQAIDKLNVHWQGLDWQLEVADISIRLHSSNFNFDMRNYNKKTLNKRILSFLRDNHEFNKLAHLFSINIPAHKLDLAVRMVSEKNN